MHLISVLVYVLIMTRKCSDNVQLILRSFYVLFGILISAHVMNVMVCLVDGDCQVLCV